MYPHFLSLFFLSGIHISACYTVSKEDVPKKKVHKLVVSLLVPSEHTHMHTPTAVKQLSEVSWLGPGLGTALPNHIAASKSSVYISNYMVACGVLDHSGRPSFHHFAVSIPAYLPHFPPLSSKILIYLFIHSYLCCCFGWLCGLSSSTHLPNNLHSLNWASWATASSPGQRNHFYDLFLVYLQFAEVQNIKSVHTCIKKIHTVGRGQK